MHAFQNIEKRALFSMRCITESNEKKEVKQIPFKIMEQEKDVRKGL